MVIVLVYVPKLPINQFSTSWITNRRNRYGLLLVYKAKAVSDANSLLPCINERSPNLGVHVYMTKIW